MKKPQSPGETLAPRLQQPSWKDPRLLIGVLIVLLSVVAVTGIVRINDRTEPYLAAKHDLLVGQRITNDDLQPVSVRLADSSSKYLSEGTRLAEGAVATQSIFEGQMVPRHSIGSVDQLRRKPMSLTIGEEAAGGIEVGQSVDVWVTESGSNGAEASDPRLVVSRAEVSRVTHDDSAIGGSAKATVQVLVEEGNLPPLIKAVSADSTITLVPTYRTDQA